MTRKLSRLASVLIAALAVLTIAIRERGKIPEMHSRSPQRVGTVIAAPNFRLPKLDGHMVSLADYRGKKVILSFWASWCGPCRRELPVLRAFFYKRYRHGDQFEVLTINLDESREAANAASQSANLPFPVALDPTRKVARAFGVHAIPTLFVIDKNGQINYCAIGFNPALDAILVRQLGVDPEIFIQGASESRTFKRSGG